MNQNRCYEIHGTQALACRFDREREADIIDYDIARRSYEARRRLAQRQQRAHAEASLRQRPAEREIARRVRLQDLVEDNYTPNRTMLDALGDTAGKVAEAISSNPFVYQLKHGTLRGFETGKTDYRNVITSVTLCLSFTAVISFL